MIPQIIFDVCREGATKRYDLSTPYPWGDWIYGTNGHIMVRCPIGCDLDLKLADGRKVPDPLRISSGQDVERIAVELPEANETKPCEWCNATGKTDRYQCDNCGDTQQVMVGGKPIQFDCPDCDGKGNVPNDEVVRVLDLPRCYLMARYVGLLRRHGVRYVSVPAVPLEGKSVGELREAITFSGDGFEGWLMPQDTKLVEQDMAREGRLNLATKGA